MTEFPQSRWRIAQRCIVPPIIHLRPAGLSNPILPSHMIVHDLAIAKRMHNHFTAEPHDGLGATIAPSSDIIDGHADTFPQAKNRADMLHADAIIDDRERLRDPVVDDNDATSIAAFLAERIVNKLADGACSRPLLGSDA